MVVAMAQIAPCSAKDNQDYSIIKNNFSHKSLKIWTDNALATKSVMVMSPRIKKGFLIIFPFVSIPNQEHIMVLPKEVMPES